MLKGKQTYNQVMHTKDLQIAQVGGFRGARWKAARGKPSGYVGKVCTQSMHTEGFGMQMM